MDRAMAVAGVVVMKNQLNMALQILANYSADSTFSNEQLNRLNAFANVLELKDRFSTGIVADASALATIESLSANYGDAALAAHSQLNRLNEQLHKPKYVLPESSANQRKLSLPSR